MSATSAAIASPVAQPIVVQTKPLRAAVLALVLGMCTMVVCVLVAHRFGALHLPVYGVPLDDPPDAMGHAHWTRAMRARELIIWVGASLLGLVLPLMVGARQMLLRRRAMPWLMVAVAAPVAIGAVVFLLFVLPGLAFSGSIN
jgi:hypothetical protein